MGCVDYEAYIVKYLWLLYNYLNEEKCGKADNRQIDSFLAFRYVVVINEIDAASCVFD